MVADDSFFDLIRNRGAEWHFNRNKRPWSNWSYASIITGGYKVRAYYHGVYYSLHQARSCEVENPPYESREVAEFWIYSSPKSSHCIGHCSVSYDGNVKWWKRLPDAVYVKMRLAQ